MPKECRGRKSKDARFRFLRQLPEIYFLAAWIGDMVPVERSGRLAVVWTKHQE
jgi:hypothetical protein